MSINVAVKEIMDLCGKADGLELYFTNDDVEIYWKNLHVHTGNPSGLERAIKAIKTLEDLGATFQ